MHNTTDNIYEYAIHMYTSIQELIFIRPNYNFYTSVSIEEFLKLVTIHSEMKLIFSARVSVEDEEQGLTMKEMEEEHPLMTITESEETSF